MTISFQTVFLAFYIAEWVLRVVMVFIVPRNRQPASSSAWLMLIMLQPTIGTILFAIFSSPKLPKARRSKQLAVDALTASELEKLSKTHDGLFQLPEDIAHAEVAKLAETLGGLPSMAGNTAKVYTDYDEAIRAQIRAIDNAKEYIHIEYFIMALDQTTQPFFDAMERAVARGIKVRVLFDAVVSRPYPKFKKMKQHLSAIGVDWYPMLPLNLLPGPNFTRPDLRNHRKLVVIDGKIGFSGSQNLIQRNYHRRDELVYEEIVIELKGPVVWQLNNVFRADWYAESDDPLKDLVEDNDMPKADGTAIVQVLPSGPSHEHDNNLKLYTSVIHAAKEEVFIVVPYFVPDESLMTAITAAAQRGVKVTMINSEIIDKILVGHAQRSFYDELLNVGVKIYLYNKPVFLHNKHVRIDSETVIIGSSNLDIRSFDLDLEINVILYDKKTVTQIKDVEQRYIKKSKKVDMRSWSERPLRSKMLDQLSRLTAALQ